ncbi:hypothetical protein GLOIN_2v1624977, partial [Rhizophagus irregularis DAOM 181602=DAOM 197198]
RKKESFIETRGRFVSCAYFYDLIFIGFIFYSISVQFYLFFFIPYFIRLTLSTWLCCVVIIFLMVFYFLVFLNYNYN